MASVNERGVIISATRSLVRAAADGDLEGVQSLLAEGIEVNGKTDRGQTALMLASVFGNEEIVQLLLSAGADTTLKDDLGLTARDWSLRRGFTEIAEVIAQASPYEPKTKSSVVPAPQQYSSPPTESNHVEPAASSEVASSSLEPVAESQEKIYEQEREHVAVDDTKRELGGAAGAILRSRSTQARLEQNFHQEDMPEDFNNSATAGVSEETASQPAEHPQEHSLIASNQPTAPFEEESTFEFSDDKFEGQLLSARSRPPSFANDPASQWSIASEPDPLTLPAELIDGPVTYSDDTKPELLSLPTEDEDYEPETTRISRRPRITVPEPSLPLEEETIRREIKVPSFHTLQPPRSMRPMLWLVIAGVLVGSAFLAYRFNSYFFANENSPVVSQSQNVNTDSSNNRQASQQSTASSEFGSKGPSATPAVSTSPVTGGPLAGTERELPKPDYPASARSKNVVGTVTMLVRVNRLGRVISWRTLDGDPLLRAAALKAAKSATFDPNKLPGNGEVVGTIRYNFPP